MHSSKIIPIILAGGRGTRLWPNSREDLPKQFCKVDGEHSLFQQCVKLMNECSLFGAPVIVTGRHYSEMAETQMRALGLEANVIIQEPIGRDTAAAIALAVELLQTAKNEIMMAIPSDHMFAHPAAFYDAVKAARDTILEQDAIVTFGIRPTHPETGYGYLEIGDACGSHDAYTLNRFIEKPNFEKASQLLKNRNVLWNAGIFMFKQTVFHNELCEHSPKINAQISLSNRHGAYRGKTFIPDEKHFEKLDSISFDYAVMEKTSHAVVVPMAPDWSDIGSWKAVWELGEKDEHNNVIDGPIYNAESDGCLVRSNGPVVGISGLSNIVVVANKDAILVTSKDSCQNVKQIVQDMKSDGALCATKHPGEDRPWGRFDSIDQGTKHQVKRIRVNAGGQLSLQYHHHRAEHWVVIAGTATVTVDDKVIELTVGEQVFVPKGAVHRLENFTNSPVEIIEVQIGDYLGEDDIVRVEDIYGRDPEPVCAIPQRATA